MTTEPIGHRYLVETIGMPIEIISQDFKKLSGNDYYKVVLQIKVEEPDLFAFGVLFTLSLMSFTFSAPRGYSEIEFEPDEEWNIDYFLQGLEFEEGRLHFSGDYVSGRHMKTDIYFDSGGKVTIETRNRGKGIDRWLIHLQGKKHIQPA
jgi:hypothetical protein